ncbi:MAG: hypothetical protein KC503_22150 [Myxococcales bacterium]|nr:hypothetical protein [Myxococcales bacterium]
MALPLAAFQATPAHANPALIAALRAAAAKAAQKYAANTMRRAINKQLELQLKRLQDRTNESLRSQRQAQRRMNRQRRRRLARQEQLEARETHVLRRHRTRGPLTATTGGFASHVVRPGDHTHDRRDRHNVARLSYRRHTRKSRIVKLGRPGF